ncbi:hypothetical protein F2Q70_00023082 [Brassica cretica]|uniref:Uncharacterized protein n=1 Tax=Brassica cretica TaxID=69181 RepID=A0A8S9GU00_BRACR|nr:hypothetical protein F2Q70_00023082 [Brassica cretica]KAF3606597.1 hypothetical protein DY000_02050085 [Brassica cretica]
MREVLLGVLGLLIFPKPNGDGPPITGQAEGGQDEGSACGRGAPPCLSELCLSRLGVSNEERNRSNSSL